MDVKVTFAIVCLCVLAITSSDAAIPKCCIGTKKAHPFIMRKVIRYEMQHSHGVCDIDALKLYFEGRKRPFCTDPSQMKKLLETLDEEKRKRQQNSLKKRKM